MQSREGAGPTVMLRTQMDHPPAGLQLGLWLWGWSLAASLPLPELWRPPGWGGVGEGLCLGPWHVVGVGQRVRGESVQAFPGTAHVQGAGRHSLAGADSACGGPASDRAGYITELRSDRR